MKPLILAGMKIAIEKEQYHSPQSHQIQLAFPQCVFCIQKQMLLRQINASLDKNHTPEQFNTSER